MYVHCVYRNVLPSMPALVFPPLNNSNGADPPQSPEQAQQSDVDRNLRYKALIKLYILADRLLDPTTANMAIDEIRRFSESVKCNPSAQAITFVFDSTKEGDGLRKLLADFIIYTGAYLPEGDVPEGFFKFVLERYLAGRRDGHVERSDFRTVIGKDIWTKFDCSRLRLPLSIQGLPYARISQKAGMLIGCLEAVQIGMR